MQRPGFQLALASLITLAGCGGSVGGVDGDSFGSGNGTDATGASASSASAGSDGTAGATDSASGGAGETDGVTGGSSDTTSGGGVTSGPTAGTSGSGGTTDASTGGTGGASATTGPPPDMGPWVPECNDVDPMNNCGAVDVLFVIDNSGSMADAQAAIGQAFPGFVNAMVEVLPCGTSLHVGVTSTEMAYVSGGSTNNCEASSNGQPVEDFYVTPDTDPSGVNGAQGRLFEANGQTYYEVKTDEPADVIQGMKDWFAAAAAIGTGGSNIEMATAPAGWVGDPANDATNAGFIRDEGAVLVVFFLQDEPDQTPLLIDDKSAGIEMLNKLAQAKETCGGANCIIGGGMINEGCMGERPIGEFLGGMGAPPVTVNFPFLNEPAPDDFVAVFEDTLAGVIAQKCEEIGPT